MIEVRHLVKKYGTLRAIDDISFEVKTGEVFGVVGPNGAGKTTLMKLLGGQFAPDCGEVLIDKFDLFSTLDDIKEKIGIVGDTQNLYERLSGYENLMFFAELYRIPNPRKKVNELLGRANLSEVSKKAVGTYSLGMRQQIMIARGLLHEPQYLFLDEPMRGLDPIASDHIRRLLAELSRTGTTIILTTHFMPDIELMCQRVAFLNKGKMVELGTPWDLRKKYGLPDLIHAEMRTGELITFCIKNIRERALLEEAIRDQQVVTLHTQEASFQDIYIHIFGGLQE